MISVGDSETSGKHERAPTARRSLRRFPHQPTTNAPSPEDEIHETGQNITEAELPEARPAGSDKGKKTWRSTANPLRPQHDQVRRVTKNSSLLFKPRNIPSSKFVSPQKISEDTSGEFIPRIRLTKLGAPDVGRVLVAQYDSSRRETLVARSVATSLNLQVVPWRPGSLPVLVKDNKGSWIEVREFVSVQADVPDLGTAADLGTCNFGILPAHIEGLEGIEILVGSRVLEKLEEDCGLSSHTRSIIDRSFEEKYVLSPKPSTNPGESNPSTDPDEKVLQNDIRERSPHPDRLAGPNKRKLPPCEPRLEKTSRPNKRLRSDQAHTFGNTEGLSLEPNIAQSKQSDAGFYEQEHTDVSLWINTPENFGNYTCLSTRYDPSLQSSLIRRSVVNRLGSQTIPYEFGSQAVMTSFGMLYCQEFVDALVEAPWLDVELGQRFNVAVVEDDWVIDWGVELWAGGDIIERLEALGFQPEMLSNLETTCSLPGQRREDVVGLPVATSSADANVQHPWPTDWNDQITSCTSLSSGSYNKMSIKSPVSDFEGRSLDLDEDNAPMYNSPSIGFETGNRSDWANFNTAGTVGPEEANDDGYSDPVPRGSIGVEEPAPTPGLGDTLFRLAGRSEPLLCLISEFRHSNPIAMTMTTSPETPWTEQWKLGLEQLTNQQWNWWPFSASKQPLKDNECRVEWLCSCGDKRRENVPFEFGQALFEFVRQRGAGERPSGSQVPMETTNLGRISSTPVSNVKNPSVQNNVAQGNAYFATIADNNTINSGPSQAQNIDTRDKHIFLVASRDDAHWFRQIVSTSQCTSAFSDNLRKRYRELRGFWCYWFSIYKFSHCDFFEFEKFNDKNVASLQAGLPPDQHPYTEDYYYEPRPAICNSPISPEEFRHIYYYRRPTSIVKVNIWYQPFSMVAQAPFYWPRFFEKIPPLFQHQSQGNLPEDTVPRIPQRFRAVEGSHREHIWGLHAREKVSAMMVLIYALLAFVPLLAFCFVYLFGLGDKQPDLQNATTPLTLSLTTFGLFIAYLAKH